MKCLREVFTVQAAPLAESFLGVHVESMYRGNWCGDSLYTYFWQGADDEVARRAVDLLEGPYGKVFKVLVDKEAGMSFVFWALRGGSVAVSGEQALYLSREESDFYSNHGVAI